MPDADDSILTYDYVSTFMLYIGTVISIIILVIFFKDFCAAKSQREASDESTLKSINQKWITYASIIAMILFVFASINLSLVWTTLVFIDQYNGNPTTIGFSSSASLPLFVSQCGLVLFILFKRMDYVYKMGKCFKITTYVLPIFAALFVFIPVMIGYIVPSFKQFGSVLTALIYLIVTIIYIVMEIMYLLKIKEKMRDCIISNIENPKTDQIEMNTIDNNENNNGYNKTDVIVDLTMINNAVRYSVLNLWCVCVSPLIPLFGLVGNALVRKPTHTSTLTAIGFVFHVPIYCLCIFLLFEFATARYMKICGCCHKCMINCCADVTIKEFAKKDQNIDKQQYRSLIVNN